MTNKRYKIYIVIYEPGVTNHYGSFIVERPTMDEAYYKAMDYIRDTFKKASLVKIFEIREVLE